MLSRTACLKSPLLLLGCCALVAAAPLLSAEAPGDKDKDATTSTATTLETADFLKAPAGLDAAGFHLARTPPVVDVCFFAGLADRGKGTLWSSWGDGCAARNGKYYTSVGDHL